MQLIPLSQGRFAKVDDADFEWLSRERWSAHHHIGGKNWYAERKFFDGSRWVTLSMHRHIMGLQYGNLMNVDHKDMDTLNNQRSNLRIASPTENRWNRRVRMDSGTGVKGVALRSSGRYRANIRVKGKRITLGHYATIEEASAVYKEAAEKYHGAFARHV